MERLFMRKKDIKTYKMLDIQPIITKQQKLTIFTPYINNTKIAQRKTRYQWHAKLNLLDFFVIARGEFMYNFIIIMR